MIIKQVTNFIQFIVGAFLQAEKVVMMGGWLPKLEKGANTRFIIHEESYFPSEAHQKRAVYYHN